jgi:ricin-type beta-trefoil lectin protein
MKTALLLVCLLLTNAVASAQVRPVPGQWYRLEAKHSGMYLDVTWGSRDEHAPIAQSPHSTWEDGAAQLWTLVPGPNGFYRLKVKHSGKFLEVTGASMAEHAPVGQTESADAAPGRPSCGSSCHGIASGTVYRSITPHSIWMSIGAVGTRTRPSDKPCTRSGREAARSCGGLCQTRQ